MALERVFSFNRAHVVSDQDTVDELHDADSDEEQQEGIEKQDSL